MRTPRPGEHKRRTIYERRISRCYARPRLPPTIAKPGGLRPQVAVPGRNHMNVAFYPKDAVERHVHGIGCGACGACGAGLEVGGGADA